MQPACVRDVVSSDVHPRLSTWQHLVVGFNGEFIDFFLDGARIVRKEHIGKYLGNSTLPFAIGCSPGDADNRNVVGRLDEVVVFKVTESNQTLDEGGVRELMMMTSTRKATTTVAQSLSTDATRIGVDVDIDTTTTKTENLMTFSPSSSTVGVVLGVVGGVLVLFGAVVAVVCLLRRGRASPAADTDTCLSTTQSATTTPTTTANTGIYGQIEGFSGVYDSPQSPL